MIASACTALGVSARPVEKCVPEPWEPWVAASVLALEGRLGGTCVGDCGSWSGLPVHCGVTCRRRRRRRRRRRKVYSELRQ